LCLSQGAPLKVLKLYPQIDRLVRLPLWHITSP
jgi:hypothetical protein